MDKYNDFGDSTKNSKNKGDLSFRVFPSRRNYLPSEDFSGLTPWDMHRLLYFDKFEDMRPLVQFNKNIGENLLLDTLIMKCEKKLVEIFKNNNDKIPLTDKGNLKVRYAKELFSILHSLAKNIFTIFTETENGNSLAKKIFMICTL